MEIIRTYQGESLDQAAKLAGYANAQEARTAGATFEELTTNRSTPIQAGIVQEPRNEVSMIDTGSAITQVNNQRNYLDTTYPTLNAPPAGRAPSGQRLDPYTNQPIPETTVGKAYFTNEAGQEAEYTQEQLRNPDIQNFLQQGGFVLSRTDGITTNINPLETAVSEANSQIENLYNQFQSYNVESDPAYQSYAQTIRNQFDQLRRQMEETNRSRQRAFETLGYRTGAAQYAGGVQMGIEGEELTQANQRIAEINNQEAEMLANARNAFQNNNFTKFNASVNALQKIRDNKQEELANYTQALKDLNDRLMDENRFELEVAKYQSSLQEKEKPMIVSPGSSIYDPTTGEFLGTAPERPEKPEAPKLEKFGNDVYQWNPNLESWDMIYSGDGDISGTALDWATAISNGTAQLTQVPNDIRNQVVTALNNLPPDQSKIAPLQDKINSIDELLSHKGLDSAVGPSRFLRSTFSIFDRFGAKADFIAGVQQLVSQDTLNTLINLKAQGGTLGALSDQERIMLQSAASKIGTWAIYKNGQVVGYNASETSFKNELNRIKTLTQRAVEKAGGGKTIESASKAIDNYYLKNPSEQQKIDNLYMMKNPNTKQPYTDEEIAQILGLSFNQSGGGTLKAAGGQGMRTDRHNNPTAFTTDIAKLAGLKKGIDYEMGDSFSGGKYHTAKLLKNPIATTIKVIDKIGFQIASGNPRWTYINIPKFQWDRMSYQEKKKVIARMYQNEGGTKLKNLFV